MNIIHLWFLDGGRLHSLRVFFPGTPRIVHRQSGDLSSGPTQVNPSNKYSLQYFLLLFYFYFSVIHHLEFLMTHLLSEILIASSPFFTKQPPFHFTSLPTSCIPSPIIPCSFSYRTYVLALYWGLLPTHVQEGYGQLVNTIQWGITFTTRPAKYRSD